MPQNIESFQAQLSAFILGREHLVLVVRCTEPETITVAKVVERLGTSSTSQLYWTITNPFQDAVSYAEAFVQTFAIQHGAMRLARERESMPPLPQLPVNLRDPAALPPVERVRALMVFSRSLLPTLRYTGVVWSLLPFQVADPQAYAAFVTALWNHEFPFPWCHHVRILVRDPSEAPVLTPHVPSALRVALASLDLSPAATSATLIEGAANNAAPHAEGADSSLHLAGIGYDHGCYDRGIQQYDVMHRYAAATQNPTLGMAVLNWRLDVIRALGQEDQAAPVLEAAFASGTRATAPLVLNGQAAPRVGAPKQGGADAWPRGASC